jgi:tRNA (guanosine-2'-O-)-methyltransferase
MVKSKEALLNHLLGFVSDNRKKKFLELVEFRTRYLTVVMEDIYQPHNASAVLRSCDCFGIQDVHIIENKNRYQLNPDVELGSSKWLHLKKYNSAADNTPECIKTLKEKGYRIVATTPHKNDCNIEDLDIGKGKIALFFGTELHGLTDTVINNADEFVKIPMVGFTESLNISVSAAISMYQLNLKLRKSDIQWQMSKEEKLEILLNWARMSVNKPELLEKDFFDRQG